MLASYEVFEGLSGGLDSTLALAAKGCVFKPHLEHSCQQRLLVTLAGRARGSLFCFLMCLFEVFNTLE